ncbi:MAG: hypothetical protein ACYCZX_12240 [Rhodospirillaceae bacterium]
MNFYRVSRLAGGVIAAAAMGFTSHAAMAAQTKSFVVSIFTHAAYSYDGDCPEGINPPIEELYRKELTLIGVPKEKIDMLLVDLGDSYLHAGPGTPQEFLVNRGRLNGKPMNAYTYPQTVPDVGFHEVKGKYAYGFNLDGRGEKSPNGFEDPDTHEKGVNNEFWRAMGCNNNQRGTKKDVPSEAALHWDFGRSGIAAWLFTIETEDFAKEGDVTVKFNKAMEHASSDASGLARADSTFRVDPDPRWQNTFHGRIKNGEITITTPSEVHMLGDPYGLHELNLKRAKLRLTLNANGTMDGVFGGYVPWQSVLFIHGNSGMNEEVVLSTDIPGAYHALRKHADADPDPKTGENAAISSAWRIVAVPAFIVSTQANAAPVKK